MRGQRPFSATPIQPHLPLSAASFINEADACSFVQKVANTAPTAVAKTRPRHITSRGSWLSNRHDIHKTTGKLLPGSHGAAGGVTSLTNEYTREMGASGGVHPNRKGLAIVHSAATVECGTYLDVGDVIVLPVLSKIQPEQSEPKRVVGRDAGKNGRFAGVEGAYRCACVPSCGAPASPPWQPSTRAVLKGGKKSVCNTNTNERSWGRSLLHDQDMGKTQSHRNSIEQCSAVGGGWPLAISGWWRLAVGGSWRLVAVGG